MSKMSPVTVTFSNGTPARRLKAESIEHTRQVVCKEFNLPNFTNEALGNIHILHVYIFFNRKNHRVEEIPKKLVKVSPRHDHIYIGKAHLKPRQPEKKKHNHVGLRQRELLVA